jgi:hypothetical protein
VAAFARFAGAAAHVESLPVPGLSAYLLQRTSRLAHGAPVVAIAWDELDPARSITLGGNVMGYDFMGNPLPAGQTALRATPVYLVSPSPAALLAALTHVGP